MANQPGFINKLIISLAEIGETKTITKGDYLIREGEIERNLYWVESGAVRVFYLPEFEQHVIRLRYKNSFINSLSSFIKQTPSEFFISYHYGFFRADCRAFCRAVCLYHAQNVGCYLSFVCSISVN